MLAFAGASGQVRLHLAHCLLSVYAAVTSILVAANMTTLSMTLGRFRV